MTTARRCIALFPGDVAQVPAPIEQVLVVDDVAGDDAVAEGAEILVDDLGGAHEVGAAVVHQPPHLLQAASRRDRLKQQTCGDCGGKSLAGMRHRNVQVAQRTAPSLPRAEAVLQLRSLGPVAYCWLTLSGVTPGLRFPAIRLF